MNAAVVRVNHRATGAGTRTTAAALPARRTVAQRGKSSNEHTKTRDDEEEKG